VGRALDARRDSLVRNGTSSQAEVTSCRQGVGLARSEPLWRLGSAYCGVWRFPCCVAAPGVRELTPGTSGLGLTSPLEVAALSAAQSATAAAQREGLTARVRSCSQRRLRHSTQLPQVTSTGSNVKAENPSALLNTTAASPTAERMSTSSASLPRAGPTAMGVAQLVTRPPSSVTLGESPRLG
jgi:hypothetical protein